MLSLNGQGYTVQDLIERNGSVREDSQQSENTNQTLSFCQQWLTGTQSFTVQTSGSTGEPKPITILRQQMVSSAQATGKALGLQRGQKSLVCLPIRYIAGRMMLVRGFVLGLDMTVVEPSSDPFAQLPEDVSFDFTALIPLQLQTLLEEPAKYQDKLNQMSAILIGGGPVSTELESQMQTITVPIYHTFGMTETVTHIALRRLNGPDASKAFTSLPGVTLGLDERGCLNIRSDVTNGEIIQTNDRVVLNKDDTFVWLGRWDNVINSGGVKVQIERVEKALEQALYELGQPEVMSRRFFVGPQPDTRLGECVTVVMEGTPLTNDQERAIQMASAAKLDRYEMPRRFMYVPKLQETPTGKVDRIRTLQSC